MVVDWGPAIGDIIIDLREGLAIPRISAAFHRGLASAIAEVSARIGVKQVVLSGGCFQNAFLTEATIASLSAAGFTPYWHRLVPPNDGGLALGQAAWAARLVDRGEIECA
jgi:hydrogenase maturation protein HypF